jgi:hypothetical protein
LDVNKVIQYWIHYLKEFKLGFFFFFLFNGGSGIGYFILPIDEEACFPLLLGSGYCVMLVRERPSGD